MRTLLAVLCAVVLLSCGSHGGKLPPPPEHLGWADGAYTFTFVGHPVGLGIAGDDVSLAGAAVDCQWVYESRTWVYKGTLHTRQVGDVVIRLTPRSTVLWVMVKGYKQRCVATLVAVPN
jgi:hypothetical protein